MIKVMPQSGIGRQALEQELEALRAGDQDRTLEDWYSRGFLFHLHVNDELRALAETAYTKFLNTDALSGKSFPSVQVLQRDLAGYVGDLLNAGDRAGGTITTGGTESIILATLAARNWARERRAEVLRPEVVVARTAHPAFSKACELLGLRLVRVPEADDYRADIRAMTKAVNENTIMLAGSAPTYWHGIIDPIAGLGELAETHDLWLHVDGCMGGLVAPFVRDLGYELPAFDFTVPALRSMSVDFHKYGFSLKGASILMLRDADDARFHTYTYEGTYAHYATPGLLGTRSGAALASAWAVFRFLGRAGFQEIARSIMRSREALLEAIRGMDCLVVRGDPRLSIISFGSNELDIFALAAALKARGWLPNTYFEPDSIHVRLTPAHEPMIPALVSDLGECISAVRAGVVQTGVTAGRYGD